MQSLTQRMGDIAVDLSQRTQITAGNIIDHLKHNGGKVVVRAALAGVSIAGSMGWIAKESSTAYATSQTCVSTSGGGICTKVNGTGEYVDSVQVSRWKVPEKPWPNICDYSAWFFYVPPSGGAYGLGYQSRNGCTEVRAWLSQPVNRRLPAGTLVCAKFFEDHNANFVSEKCVGLSGGSGGGGW
jgi:hypothetical protein